MKEDMMKYGNYVVITQKDISREIVAGCVNELIKSIDDDELDVQWNTLEVIIKKADEEHLTPFDVVMSEDGETEVTIWWTIAIRFMAAEKNEERHTEENLPDNPEER